MNFADYASDLVALCLVVVLICVYHTFLWRRARRDPTSVLTSAAALARRGWVATVMDDHHDAILAVQTLRNSTMAASFLASTAILLMVGALTLSGQAGALKQTWHLLNVFGTSAPELWLVKVLSLLLILLFAFFNFINAIRVFNHVGYMVSLRDGREREHFPAALVARELNRGAGFFSLGMRSYYYLVPLVCWLFGPLYMVLATLLLILGLLPRIDMVPKLEPAPPSTGRPRRE